MTAFARATARPGRERIVAQIYPLLHVTDIERTVAFYRDMLGFTVLYVGNADDGKVEHGEVEFNGATLMFGRVDAISAPARSMLGAGVVLYIQDNTLDIDAYYESVREHDVKIVEEIADQFWGDRNFAIADPDGYVITIGAKVSEFEPEPAVSGASTT
jgi:uncharacterized glyoxalase superfamily protein PhnB